METLTNDQLGYLTKYINFSGISRTLSGSPNTIHRYRIPGKHLKAVSELSDYLRDWEKNYLKTRKNEKNEKKQSRA